MIIKFYATREIARIVARTEGETFKDMGTTAEKGKRWAVQFKELSDIINSPEPVLTDEEQAKANELADLLNGVNVNVKVNAAAWSHADALAALKRPESVSRRCIESKHDRKGNRVTVYSKRKIAVL